jgi:hypothetical protein
LTSISAGVFYKRAFNNGKTSVTPRCFDADSLRRAIAGVEEKTNNRPSTSFVFACYVTAYRKGSDRITAKHRFTKFDKIYVFRMPDQDEIDQSEEMRILMAENLGLPQDASWDDVEEAEDVYITREMAKDLKLPLDTLIVDIGNVSHECHKKLDERTAELRKAALDRILKKARHGQKNIDTT